MGVQAQFRQVAAILVMATVSAGTLKAGAQPRGGSLRQRVGLDAATAQINSAEEAERLRGVERLGAIGTDKALDRLTSALRPGTTPYGSPAVRLAAIRILADHLDEERYQAAVASAYVAVAGETSGILRLIRDTAARALARQGDRASLTPLITAVLMGGPGADKARELLAAHPPSEVSVFQNDAHRLGPDVLALLGDVADPRVLGWLRSHLKNKGVSDEQKRAAGIALAKLRDDHARAFVKTWREADDPFKRIAAAEAAMWLEMPEAPGLIAKLMGKAKTRAAGLRLADVSLSPALVPTLAAVIAAEVTALERQRATAILARMGESKSAVVLLELLKRPKLTTQAALALAQNPSRAAHVGLERALAQAPEGPGRRLAMRTGVVRALRLGRRLSGLVGALSEALDGSEPADRAVGAFGLVALGEASVSDLIARPEPEVRAGAARGALARGPSAISALKPLLKDPKTRVLAAPALLLDNGGLSPSDLAKLADEGGILAPLAAYRLALIDSRAHRPRLLRLLNGTDPDIQLQIVLGLAHSPEPDAVSLLVSLYPFEPDLRKRGAVVRALSRRTEKLRETTLKMARDHDPDPQIRRLAGDALKGVVAGPTARPAGRRTLWFTLREAEPSGAGAGRPAVVIRDDGLAWPAMSAPDGVLLVPGLGERGKVSLRLAPTPLAPAPPKAKDQGPPKAKASNETAPAGAPPAEASKTP